MNEPVERLSQLLFPSILAAFLSLYVVSLATGVEPEVGLLGAGSAGIVLAVLGRIAIGIVESAPKIAPRPAESTPERDLVDAELDALKAGLEPHHAAEAGQTDIVRAT